MASLLIPWIAELENCVRRKSNQNKKRKRLFGGELNPGLSRAERWPFLDRRKYWPLYYQRWNWCRWNCLLEHIHMSCVLTTDYWFSMLLSIHQAEVKLGIKRPQSQPEQVTSATWNLTTIGKMIKIILGFLLVQMRDKASWRKTYPREIQH